MTMDTLALPFDIIAEIIDVLADEKDWTSVKNISSVSSFCRDQCRKRLFASITISEDSREWDDHKEAFPLPSTYDFTALVKNHPETVPYIRHMCLVNPHEQHDADFTTALTKLDNLNSLEIHILKEQGNWTPLLSRSLQALSGISSLERLSLHGINRFPLKDLAPLHQLHHLELDHVDLLEDPSVHVHLPPIRLRSLVLVDFDEYDYDPRIASLKMKRQDGKFLIDLSAMKALYFSPFINQASLEQASDLIRSQRIQSLEELSLGVEFLDDKIMDIKRHAQQLQDCILPHYHSLQKLSFFSRCGDQPCVRDPYSTLCTTLEILEKNNVLTSLEITVNLSTFDHDTTIEAEQWQKLCTVLVKPGWKRLTSVSIRVWSFDLVFEEEIEKLSGYFAPLLRQPFKFNLDVDPFNIT